VSILLLHTAAESSILTCDSFMVDLYRNPMKSSGQLCRFMSELWGRTQAEMAISLWWYDQHGEVWVCAM